MRGFRGFFGREGRRGEKLRGMAQITKPIDQDWHLSPLFLYLGRVRGRVGLEGI